MTYTAANIRVLSDWEVDERFTWARVGELAERYSRPADWIARGLEACRRAGVEPGYFIARYLERDATTPFDSTVDEAMREILIEQQQARRRKEPGSNHAMQTPSSGESVPEQLVQRARSRA